MTKKELFIKLCSPNNNGFSRWVHKTEFINEYESLNFNNGCPWARNMGYLYETKVEKKTWMIRLVGKTQLVDKRISKDIRQKISSEPSCHSGLPGTKNDYILPDHKNGRYNDFDVLNLKTQKLEDFQPLTLRENLFKRQMCKICKQTNKRFDAKRLNYSISFIEGDENYNEQTGCNGCYWFDCKKFKESLK